VRVKHCLQFLAFLAFCSSTAPLQAATDGSLGASSTGDTDISLTVPDLVKIGGISDLAFGSYTGTGNISQDDDVCVWTNVTTADYVVTASGSGTASAFTLTDGSETIAYQVFWNDVAGTSGSVELSTGVASATQTGANTTALDCSGGVNANFQVTMSQSVLLAVAPNSYAGVLTLTIEPAP